MRALRTGLGIACMGYGTAPDAVSLLCYYVMGQRHKLAASIHLKLIMQCQVLWSRDTKYIFIIVWSVLLNHCLSQAIAS
jgi:hypothetical protein